MPPKNPSIPTIPVSQYITDVLAARQLSVRDFADQFLSGRVEFAELLLAGKLKVPVRRVGHLAEILKVDETDLRARIAHEYFGDVLPPRSVGMVPTDSRAALSGGPVSGTWALNNNVTNLSDDEATTPVEHWDGLLLPMLRVRMLFAELPDGFTAREAAEVIRLSGCEAEVFLSELANHDFVTRHPHPSRKDLEDVWKLRPLAGRVLEKPIPDPLTRPSAEKILARFLKDIAKFNARDEFPYRVTGVTVVGELLEATRDEPIPHVEVSVILRKRFLDPIRQADVYGKAMTRSKATVVDLDARTVGTCELSPLWDAQEAVEAGTRNVAIRWYFDQDPSDKDRLNLAG